MMIRNPITLMVTIPSMMVGAHLATIRTPIALLFVTERKRATTYRVDPDDCPVDLGRPCHGSTIRRVVSYFAFCRMELAMCAVSLLF